MRLLLLTERGERLTLPDFGRRSALALYLQARRRKRKAGENPPDLSDGLVAHFAFEESPGDRTDGVNGYVLQEIITELYTTYGLMGAGVAFNADGYLMGTTQTSLFSPSANGFTVSIWVNFADITDPFNDAYIVSVWDDANWPSGSSWQIWSGNPSSNSINAQVMGTSWAYLSGSADLSQWTHICLVYEPAEGKWRLYINGALAMSVSFDFSSETGTLGVGGHTNFVATAPEGAFDELAIWSRDLSATEVALLYNNGAGLAYPY